ncbi:MAG: hypothetical protein U1F81_18195 [Verrucomicrobiaceae bacterium]
MPQPINLDKLREKVLCEQGTNALSTTDLDHLRASILSEQSRLGANTTRQNIVVSRMPRTLISPGYAEQISIEENERSPEGHKIDLYFFDTADSQS